MKITFKKGLLAAIAALTVCSARADEGMWLLQLMKQQNSIDMMKKQGLKLEADDLYNPNGVSLKDAVGIFGGGCTGEIISPEGLISNQSPLRIRFHPATQHRRARLSDRWFLGHLNRREELAHSGTEIYIYCTALKTSPILSTLKLAGEITESESFSCTFLNKLAKELIWKERLERKKRN